MNFVWPQGTAFTKSTDRKVLGLRAGSRLPATRRERLPAPQAPVTVSARCGCTVFFTFYVAFLWHLLYV